MTIKSYRPGVSKFLHNFNGQRIVPPSGISNWRTIIFFQDIQKALSAFPYIQILYKLIHTMLVCLAGWGSASNSDLNSSALMTPNGLIPKIPAKA